MTAQAIAAWATQNGFNSLNSMKYRRSDDARTITIEIKRFSVVLIEERVGFRPCAISKLFKNLFLESSNGRFERLLLERLLIAAK